MARTEAPTLDRLAILDDRGFRKKIHPADVDGKFQRLKPWVRWGLIAIFVTLPWIDVGGHPAVLFDVPARHFYLFGHIFGPGDLPFLFFLLIAGSWGLVVGTALFGRVWCGWACPQTVYLEAVFRRIERVIEGTGAQRMALDMAPWHAGKIAKKALKWFLWALASFVVAHLFLSYFVSLPRVVSMVQEAPTQHWGVFLFAAFVTGITYANFAWFREQICLIICPYGRLQSALQDRDSVVIGYDVKRGEPRGKKTDGATGDCVDCRRCVQVCPTGIDIRNGLQMECIGCAACVDACDDVMLKLHRAPGLVRYDSERTFATGARSRRFLRPRVIGYGIVGAVGLTAIGAFAFTRDALVARPVRPAGIPWAVVPATEPGQEARVRNTAMIHVENRSSHAHDVTVAVDAANHVDVQMPVTQVHVAPQDRTDFPIIVRVPLSQWTPSTSVVVHVRDEAGDDTAVRMNILGPPRSKVAAP